MRKLLAIMILFMSRIAMADAVSLVDLVNNTIYEATQKIPVQRECYNPTTASIEPRGRFFIHEGQMVVIRGQNDVVSIAAGFAGHDYKIRFTLPGQQDGLCFYQFSGDAVNNTNVMELRHIVVRP